MVRTLRTRILFAIAMTCIAYIAVVNSALPMAGGA